ncbi:sirohydrochlorin chelatase [Nocardia iowensis]|uniref:Sirohydrochlorin chelatase n=1 Tax=Nocardia iowensis TaxID=204891 RepID=A0ABX8S0E0_NOCIO|nr:CbiX/SirB N-terminal domain-containing protein [Nocardia iowensis]QXN95439.1 sirohydrochlorin chelatase [Nocardia iowensis]
MSVAPLVGEAAPRRGAPALIAVAHGSRDPRSAATMSAVVEELAAARPGFDVRLAFLDLSAPSVEQVVDAVAAQGHTHAVVAPMLLGNAFHARVDLPGLLAAAHTRHPQLHLTQADVLGPDIRLIAALRDRVTEACDSIAATRYPPSDATRDRSDTTRDMSISATQDPTSSTTRIETSRGPLRTRPNCRLGIAVAAVGSSSPAANARTAAVARRLAALTGHLTEICFATTEPTVSQAISRLHARGADDVLVAPWFLAPGLLTDRLATAAPNLVHANVIGPHSALTEIVWDRYDAAVANNLVRSA